MRSQTSNTDPIEGYQCLHEKAKASVSDSREMKLYLQKLWSLVEKKGTFYQE